MVGVCKCFWACILPFYHPLPLYWYAAFMLGVIHVQDWFWMCLLQLMWYLCLSQGAKLRKYFGFPFGKPPQKIGFPKIFQVFRIENENLSYQKLDFYGLSSRKSLSKNWLSDSVFGCPGKPVISHPAVCRTHSLFLYTNIIWTVSHKKGTFLAAVFSLQGSNIILLLLLLGTQEV